MQLQHAGKLPETRPELREELVKYAAHVQRTPADAKINGMYVVGLAKLARQQGLDLPVLERARHFRYYPLAAYMDLLLYCAVNIYPASSVRDALRGLGRSAIPTFATSLVGKVMMKIAERNWELALNGLSRGYHVSLVPGSASVTEFGAGRAVVELRQICNFPDSYQVGVIEGLMLACGIQGRITPRALSPCDADLTIEWAVH